MFQSGTLLAAHVGEKQIPVEEQVTGRLRVTTTPVYVKECFGWLHSCENSESSSIAVLLCPGLLRDALDSHHALRLLADELAVAGYPTMRFDYPGTGDSGETDDHWTAWQHSVHEAADWLRSATGASELVVCGLRIGATLATLVAAQRDDIVGVILLEPVVRGRSFMTQLRVEARLQRVNVDKGLNLYELQLSAETVERINQVDLRNVELTAKHRVIIISQSESKVLTECVRYWTACGAVTASSSFAGLEPMLAHNEQGAGRPADFSTLVNWLLDAVPPRHSGPVARGLATASYLQMAGCIETPLRFGPERRLFGMLCEPGHGTTGLAIVIANAGRDPHYGAGRFGVDFARRLAREGIASLRIDFAGFGDSIGPPGKEKILGSMFETDRAPDIMAAIDLLRDRGYIQFGVHGLCAGAFHALHSALVDPRIGIILLINLPTFTWRAGDTVEFVHRITSTPRRYFELLRRKSSWGSLLRGQYDLLDIIYAQSQRLYLCASDQVIRLVEWLLGKPLRFSRRAMATLSGRGVRTLFLVASGDRGVDVLNQEFGRGAAALHAFKGASWRLVIGMDHSVANHGTKLLVADLLIDFLRQSVCLHE